jgi:hypothetical protein
VDVFGVSDDASEEAAGGFEQVNEPTRFDPVPGVFE